MFWPEISTNDLSNLDISFTNLNYHSCLKSNKFAGFIFFDIGGVLLDLDWDLFISSFEALFPNNCSKDINKIRLALKEDEIYKKWCTGRLGACEYANSVLAAFKNYYNFYNLESSISIHDIKKADSYVVGAPRTLVLELAKKLRSMNFGIGVLSNATTWHEICIEKRIPVRDIFDVTIFSQDVGYEKPDYKIYELAFLEAHKFILNKFNIKLEEKDVYFIDDTPKNVRTAIKAGWNSSLVNLVNDEILKKVFSGHMNDEELKIASRKREHLLFGHDASLRVMKIFRNIVKI